jgi:hypothetical protein
MPIANRFSHSLCDQIPSASLAEEGNRNDEAATVVCVPRFALKWKYPSCSTIGGTALATGTYANLGSSRRRLTGCKRCHTYFGPLDSR